MDGLILIILTIIVVVSILRLLQWFSPLSKSERSEHDVANRLQYDSIIKDGGKVLPYTNKVVIIGLYYLL